MPIRVSDVGRERTVRVKAGPAEREALAKALNVEAVERLEALLTLRPWRRHGLRVTGDVSATVGQICTVSLDPMSTEIEDTFDERFLPAERADRRPREEVVDVEATDDYETFEDDTVDLGALVTEFLAMGIDPHPKKPGVEFDAGEDEAGVDKPESPFAVLAGRFGTADPDKSGDGEG